MTIIDEPAIASMASRRLLKGLHLQPGDIADSSSRGKRSDKAELYEIGCVRGATTSSSNNDSNSNPASSGREECQIALMEDEGGVEKETKTHRAVVAETTINDNDDKDELKDQFDKVKWRKSDWRFSFTGESGHWDRLELLPPSLLLLCNGHCVITASCYRCRQRVLIEEIL